MKDEIIKMAREAGLAKTRVYKARTISKLENTDAIERFFHMAQAAALEKVKTLTDEQMEKIIRSNMQLVVNVAGVRIDMVEAVES